MADRGGGMSVCCTAGPVVRCQSMDDCIMLYH